MKRLILLMLILAHFACNGQGLSWPFGLGTNTLAIITGGIQVNGPLRLPLSYNGFATKDSAGLIWFDVSSHTIYYHNGTVRLQIAGGGGSTDTTSLSNRINAKQSYSDTNTYDVTRWYISQNYLPLSGGTINGNLIVTDGAGITIMNANSNDNIYILGDLSATSIIHLIGSVDINGDVPLTTIAGIHIGGDLTGTLPSPTLATSGVTSGTYGSTNRLPSIVVDAKGRITSASEIGISGVTPGGSAGGDLTGTYPNPTLGTSGVTASTYGSSTSVPRFAVDAKGRITSVIATTIDAYTQGAADARFAPIAINGTVTKDSAGYGLLGGNVTTSGYKAVDSTLQATRPRVQKAVDSLNALIATKGAGTVTSVTGTTNQIAVATGTTTPVLSLPSGGTLPGAWGLGTPASVTLTNATGTATGLTVGTASTVTTNANLTGDITSSGNATTAAATLVKTVVLNTPSVIYTTPVTFTTATNTATGTLALANQNPHTVLIGATSGTTTPTFRVLAASDLPTLNGYLLVSVTIYSVAGTYTFTPAAGTTAVEVTAIGGGGGAAATKTGAAASASSGGGGQGAKYTYFIPNFTQPTAAITVGSLGTAGLGTGVNSVSPTSGGNGGNSTFTDGVTTYTAPGGSGSVYVLNAATVHVSRGGTGGTLPTTPGENIAGFDGGDGIGNNSGVAWGGIGGGGGGGHGATAISTLGTAGQSPGAGGGGSTTGSSNTNSNDGTSGFAGLVMVKEYKKI